MKTTFDYLFRVESPYIYVGAGEPERSRWNSSHFYSRSDENVCVRRLRGAKMSTTSSLMDEFAAVLQFFEGFGSNWYALRECLEYMDEWLPADAYVLVVEDAGDILRNESEDELVFLLKTFHEAGEWWAKPVANNDRFNRDSVPFHVLLNLAEKKDTDAQRIENAAARAGVPVRN
jgi:hypothetical protein